MAVGSEVRASASSLLRLADRAVLPCPSCSRMLASERRVSGRRCCDGKETSLLDLFQVAGGSVSSGMEIGGEAVVAGCCGEELLLLWCSLEAGVDGLPSLLLFVGLAAGAGSAERGKNGGRPREPEEEGRCWEQGNERPRGGKVPAAVLAGEKRERPRGREAEGKWPCGGSCEGGLLWVLRFVAMGGGLRCWLEKEKKMGGTAWRPVSKRGGSGEEGKEMVVPAGSKK